jgi:hypothetical protein
MQRGDPMKARHKLRAYYSKKERDVILDFPPGSCTKSDGHWLAGVFNTAFTDELARRGYDVTTMRFSVEPRAGHDKFAAEVFAD